MPSTADTNEPPRGTWRARVLNEAQRIENELAAAPPDPSVDVAAIKHNIERARAAAAPGGPLVRLRDWLSGAAFETAWASLHGADELLTVVQKPEDVRAGITDVVAALDAGLNCEDRRLGQYRRTLETIAGATDPNLTARQRAEIRAARRAANTATYVAQGVVRRWRNLLLVVGLALVVIIVALAIVDAAVGDFLPLGGPGGEDGPQVWEVELMGAFGGAIAAILAINRFSGYTDPHGLPLYQALLRIPVAAAVALLGVILLQSGVIAALDPQTTSTVLAYAIFFGYAQEPLLRMIDRRAGEVLGPARGKDDPGSQHAPAPTAGATAGVNAEGKGQEKASTPVIGAERPAPG